MVRQMWKERGHDAQPVHRLVGERRVRVEASRGGLSGAVVKQMGTARTAEVSCGYDLPALWTLEGRKNRQGRRRRRRSGFSCRDARVGGPVFLVAHQDPPFSMSRMSCARTAT